MEAIAVGHGQTNETTKLQSCQHKQKSFKESGDFTRCASLSILFLSKARTENFTVYSGYLVALDHWFIVQIPRARISVMR